MNRIIIIFVLLVISYLSLADTQIPAGNVSGIWELSGSPFYINGEITIPNNATLNIESGVEVIFTGFYKFNVQGQLLAIGTEENLIHFTINDTTGFSNTNSSAGGWHAIRFDNTPVVNDSSKIIYCKLEYAKAYGGGERFGGAIYINNFSKVLISNSIITNNMASGWGKGAGIYCENANLNISNNEFINNYVSWGRGGGIHCDYSNLLINNNIFRDNTVNSTASEGAGIYCDHSNSVITNNIFDNNIASGTGADGAGIYCISSSEPLIIMNNTFLNNQLYGNCDSGSAIGVNYHEYVLISDNYFGGNRGGIHISQTTNAVITQNIFENNIFMTTVAIGADSIYISENEICNNTGRGISIGGSTGIIENNLISGNSSNQKGAGISVSGSNFIIQNNEIIGNYSSDKGGGLYLYGANPGIIRNNIIKGNSTLNKGGAIYTYSGNLTIENNLFEENTCQYDGGAIYLCHASGDINIIKNIFTDNHSINSEGGAIYSFGSDCDPNIINNTFVGNSADNSGGAIYSDFSTCYIENSILWNNLPNEISGGVYVTYSDIEGGYNGIGNINADPLFEDIGNGNFNLTENSPCLDAGNPNSPPDPDGTIIDMGALYFPHIAIYADFTVNTVLGSPPLTVHFTDLSHSPNTNIVAWLWDFDNNGTIDSYVQNPTYIYEEEGVYSVSLTAIGEEGDIDTELKEDYITVHIPTIINIPDDEPTIQAGIDIAVPGDIVLVHPGTYIENINFNGKNITVGSLFLTTQDTTYISQTIIDGNQELSTAIFCSGEDSTAVLYGVTITNGLAVIKDFEWGGGIFCHNSSPTLTDLVVSDNTAYFGGGIAAHNHANPKIVNSIIKNNQALSSGGGIFSNYNSNPIIRQTAIIDNESDGNGGGIVSWESEMILDNVTLAGNSSNSAGGGIYLGNSNCSINSSILWDNFPEEIILYSFEELSSVTISYSDIQNGISGIIVNNGTVNWLNGNEISNPLFIENYHLSENSPCIDAGDPSFQLDPDGTITDMGFFFFNQGIPEMLELLYFTANYLSENNGQINWTTNNEINVLGFNIYRGESEDDFQNGEAILINDELIAGSGTTSEPIEYEFQDENNLMSGVDYYYWLECVNYAGSTEIFGAFPLLNVLHTNIHIAVNGSDDTGDGTEENPFATIQHGIYISQNGDSIFVHPGIYNENINYNGKSIIIGSLYLTTQDTCYISQTIIDGNENGSVVRFESNEDTTSVLCGFTITNGTESGIYCANSSPTILRSKIIANSTSNYGAGIRCENNSNPILKFTEITNNISQGSGGGIGCLSGSSPILTNVTIANNTAGYLGGGISCIAVLDFIMINSIMWDNEPFELHIYNSDLHIFYSDIQGGWLGEGNIYEDPLFTDPVNGNFHLTEESPCIDAGTSFFEWNGNIIIDLDEDEYFGLAPEMGAYEYCFVEADENYNIPHFKTVLFQNYPNPFNPETAISFQLSADSKVDLKVYNIKGQKVKTLVNELLPAGEHSAIWNGRDDNNKPVGSGIYFFKLRAGKFTETKKMILLK
ncbi:MAG: right-handed parallel beta-helix repeat-containing protein [Candidatus Cloacimonetes bacterium]|nr:right-handed parallel beta-helix repeat-containing protein [Candidatus Cloacimonadota bacterium]